MNYTLDNIASFQGTYSGSTTYAQGDIVAYNSSSYVSLINSNTGNEPDTNPSDWAVLAAQGPTGDTGATGATGATGPAGPGAKYAYNGSGTSVSLSLDAGTYIITYQVWNSGTEQPIGSGISGYSSAPVPMPTFNTRGGSGLGIGIYTRTSTGTLTANNGYGLYPVLMTAVQIS